MSEGQVVQSSKQQARITGLERQLADERSRIDCATRGGWLSEDLECAGEDGPACWRHLLAEAQEKLDAIEGRLSEIVEECEEVGEDPSYLFSVFFLEAEAARILKGE